MKIVKFLFNGLGYNNVNQANIYVYDLNNKLLCKTKTFNNSLNLSIGSNCFYKVVACKNNETIKKVIYVNNLKDTYCFAFNNSLIDNNLNIVAFNLTDNNYKDLVIEKGKLMLWQKQ